jgi:hypothetical protein
MRLGNHAEAEQAASYIGRRHTFVLSQRTVTLGTNDSVTRTDTDGRGTSDSGTVAFGAGNPLDLGQRSRGDSTSRNWSTGMSWAEGTSWSEAAGTQRVYEYAVEPAVLQNLPDRALLLAVRATAGSAGARLRAVECDPGIVTLPGASTRPLAALPMPRRSGGAPVMSAAATTRRHQPR